jgi:hypothetical protein
VAPNNPSDEDNLHRNSPSAAKPFRSPGAPLATNLRRDRRRFAVIYQAAEPMRTEPPSESKRGRPELTAKQLPDCPVKDSTICPAAQRWMLLKPRRAKNPRLP